MILPMNKSDDLGDVVLQRGFSINATLLLPGGLPAVNVDSDTRDALTGETVWTPGDNSDATGTFHVVLPVGSYDFVVCPKVATGLLAQEFQGVPIVGDFFGGTHTLQPGVLVTGTVLDVLGQPLKNIDVDLLDPLTGAEVPLCGDNTNVAGQYSIIAPPGTYDLAFTPPHDQFFGSSLEAGVVVSIPVTVNGVLPDCPPPMPYGTGLAGAGGIVPELSTEGGSSRLGNDEFALDISDAVGGASAWLVLGDVQASIPFHSGTLLVDSTPPAGNGPGIVQGEALKNRRSGCHGGGGTAPVDPPLAPPGRGRAGGRGPAHALAPDSR